MVQLVLAANAIIMYIIYCRYHIHMEVKTQNQTLISQQQM